jgi:hypothetical protein
MIKDGRSAMIKITFNTGLSSRRYRQAALLAAFAVGLFSSASAYAAEYYMSPSGSDSNPGTLAAPWKSMDKLQAAQSSLRPGDTVYFRGGEYVVNDSASRTYYTWTADGTSSAPITYKNYAGEAPVIVFDRVNSSNIDSWGVLVYASGNNSIIDGLNFKQTERSRLRGMPGGGVYKGDWTPTAISTYASNVTIRNCSIENFAGLGIFYHGQNLLVEKCRIIGTGSHGFYVAGRAGTFRYNELDGSRGYPNQQGIQLQYETSVGNKIYGNLIKNGRASGVVFSGSVSGNEVFNNVFVNAGSKPDGSFGYALSFWCQVNYDKSPAQARPGNKFYNNTIIGQSNSGVVNTSLGTPQGGQHCQRMNGGRPIAENVAIYNNIFYPSSPPSTVLREISTMKNNIFYNIKGSVPSGNTLVNPMLKNPNGNTSEDAMLLEGSPAIDKAPNGAPALDYRSGTRPVGAAADIGAFEFGAPPGPGGGPLGSDTGFTSGPILLGPNGEVCPTGF